MFPVAKNMAIALRKTYKESESRIQNKNHPKPVDVVWLTFASYSELQD